MHLDPAFRRRDNNLTIPPTTTTTKKNKKQDNKVWRYHKIQPEFSLWVSGTDVLALKPLITAASSFEDKFLGCATVIFFAAAHVYAISNNILTFFFIGADQAIGQSSRVRRQKHPKTQGAKDLIGINVLERKCLNTYPVALEINTPI